MSSFYEMNQIQKKIDLTAIRIFFSVVAILLSVTLPNALAIQDQSTSVAALPLQKIETDVNFRNELNRPFWLVENKDIICSPIELGSDLSCLASAKE